jgi:hypothetical protein
VDGVPLLLPMLGILVQLIVLLVAVVRYAGRVERQIAELKGSIDTRLRVLESRIDDLWEEFIERRRPRSG